MNYNLETYPWNVAVIADSSISDGRKEVVHFDKITSRIQKLMYNLNTEFVDPVSSL